MKGYKIIVALVLLVLYSCSMPLIVMSESGNDSVDPGDDPGDDPGEDPGEDPGDGPGDGPGGLNPPDVYDGPTSTDNMLIVADHTAVDDFENIPDEYLAIVRTYWVQALGESHSAIFRYGVESLYQEMGEDPRYLATRQEYGSAPYESDPDNVGLLVNRIYWDRYRSNDDPSIEGNWDQLDGTSTLNVIGSKTPVGISEEEFWTTQWAVDYMKENILGSNDPARGNRSLTAVLFVSGWHIATGTYGETDEEFGTRWGGRSFYFNSNTGTFETGYSETRGWGLDEADKALVDNDGARQHPVSLTDMLNAINQMNGVDADTIVMIATDAVDVNSTTNVGESGYQRYLKHQYMREYVAGNGGVLFDQADILSHNNAGEQATLTWTNRNGDLVEFPTIHPENDGEYTGSDGVSSQSSHIGREGCIRVAKALWWTMARIAGWDGNP